MVQGEDGISFDALSSTLDGSTGVDKNAWSYKSALALLSSNDNAGMGAEVERTSVASIIAAARSNLRRGREGEEENDNEKAGSDSPSSDSNDEDEDDASDDDSSSGSSSSDDEVDDAEKAAHSMESDVLKVQERPQRKKKEKKEASSATVVESPNEVDDESSSRDDDEDDDNEEEEDDEDMEEDDDSEDERKEASKAAAFFDSSHIATTQDSTIDSFSQLGLSRPLLRGVASMGFVSPTPIQASVIPVALAGRDVCASAVTGSELRPFDFVVDMQLLDSSTILYCACLYWPSYNIQVAKLLHFCSRSWSGYCNEVEVEQHLVVQMPRGNKTR